MYCTNRTHRSDPTRCIDGTHKGEHADCTDRTQLADPTHCIDGTHKGEHADCIDRTRRAELHTAPTARSER